MRLLLRLMLIITGLLILIDTTLITLSRRDSVHDLYSAVYVIDVSHGNSQWGLYHAYIDLTATPVALFNVYAVHPDPNTMQMGPRYAPDGKWIAFLCDGCPEGSGIYRVRPNGRDLEPIIVQSGYGTALEWSPDSQQLAFIYACSETEVLDSNCLYLWDFEARSLKTVLKSSIVEMSWSPDGKELAVIHEGKLSRLPLADPQPQTLEMSILPWRYVDWRGDHIFFQSAEGLYKIPVTGGEPQLVYSSSAPPQ